MRGCSIGTTVSPTNTEFPLHALPPTTHRDYFFLAECRLQSTGGDAGGDEDGEIGPLLSCHGGRRKGALLASLSEDEAWLCVQFIASDPCHIVYII